MTNSVEDSALDYDFMHDPIDLLRALWQNSSILPSCSSFLEPNHFVRKAHKWIYRKLQAYYKKFRTVPTRGWLVRCLNKTESDVDFQKQCSSEIEKLADPITVREAVTDEIACFVKRKSYEAAIIEAAQNIKDATSDKLEELDALFTKCKHAAAFGDNSVISLGNNMLQHINLLSTTKAPVGFFSGTGIPEIDKHLDNGGVGPGELGLWMAPYNRGKSFALLQIAINAQRMGRNVLYVSLEMGKHKIMERLIAATTGGKTKNLKPDVLPNHRADFESRFSKMYNNSKDIQIRSYPTRGATVDVVKSDMLRMMDTGRFLPEVLVLDYGDIIKPEGKAVERDYSTQGGIFEEIRGLGGELGIPVWTATQANRDSLKKQTVKGGNVSESMIKMNIADVVLTLGQNEEEQAQKVLRVYLDKNRDGEKGYEVAIRTGYSWGRFYNGTIVDGTVEAQYIQDSYTTTTVGDQEYLVPVDWLDTKYVTP